MLSPGRWRWQQAVFAKQPLLPVNQPVPYRDVVLTCLALTEPNMKEGPSGLHNAFSTACGPTLCLVCSVTTLWSGQHG